MAELSFGHNLRAKRKEVLAVTSVRGHRLVRRASWCGKARHEAGVMSVVVALFTLKYRCHHGIPRHASAASRRVPQSCCAVRLPTPRSHVLQALQLNAQTVEQVFNNTLNFLPWAQGYPSLPHTSSPSFASTSPLTTQLPKSGRRFEVASFVPRGRSRAPPPPPRYRSIVHQTITVHCRVGRVARTSTAGLHHGQIRDLARTPPKTQPPNSTPLNSSTGHDRGLPSILSWRLELDLYQKHAQSQ